LIGAVLPKAGTAPLLWPGILKTAAFIFVAPLLGMALGALIMLTVSWICFRQPPRRVDRWFRRLQLFSSAAYSLGHGGNDAQKTMGVIWLLLIANGITTVDRLPTWVVMSCFVAMGVGTMFGGWRIVKTMGQRITKLTPVGGFAAEIAGSITLFMATHFGIPVSTTHTITGAIVGVGTTRGTSGVRWGVAGNIVIAWIVTIPASAAIAALAWWISGALL
jgi:PiT family inorganic phosphate transporter